MFSSVRSLVVTAISSIVITVVKYDINTVLLETEYCKIMYREEFNLYCLLHMLV